jgi:hypothetical protein
MLPSLEMRQLHAVAEDMNFTRGATSIMFVNRELSNCGRGLLPQIAFTQWCSVCRVQEQHVFGGIGMSIRREDKFALM